MCGSPVVELLSNVKTIHLGFLDAEVMQMRREHILAKILCVLQEFRKTGANSEFIRTRLRDGAIFGESV